MDKPLILIYTGNGKGKTSACVGQTVRALGQGLRVAFVQFMKRDEQAGEQILLRSLLQEYFYVGGRGFFRHEDERLMHTKAAYDALQWAQEHTQHVQMLVLDESLYALHSALLSQKDIEHIISLAKTNNTHLVLSGRYAPEWLQDAAHLVTVMEEKKHPWQQGIKAQKGIEF